MNHVDLSNKLHARTPARTPGTYAAICLVNVVRKKDLESQLYDSTGEYANLKQASTWFIYLVQRGSHLVQRGSGRLAGPIRSPRLVWLLERPGRPKRPWRPKARLRGR